MSNIYDKKTNNGEIEKAKQEIRELGKYIEEFLTFLPFPLCIVNLPGAIIDVNNAFVDLTGYGEIEIVGKRINVLFANEREAENIKKRIFTEKIIKNHEVTVLTKGKNKIVVSLSASLRKNEEGELIGYFLVFSDVGELKKLQAELEEKVIRRTGDLEIRTNELEDTRKALINMLEDVEEERLKAEEERSKTQAIITNFVDGILVFDRENVLTRINPQAETFFQTKGGKIIGKSIAKLSKLPILKFLIKSSSNHSDAVAEIKEIFRKELKISDNLILEISTFPILREKEKLGTSVILHDISREKLIERMKTEFVSLAAHQLRTPLSAIKWTLRMLLDGDLGKINREQENFIQKTYQSNERMISLINDLLNVTRIEEGRYLFELSFIGIEDVLQPIIKSYQESMKRKKIKLVFKKPKTKLPKIKIDSEKVGLAIENLIDNALRYTFPGGLVTVALRYVKEEIEISVKDSGVGIPEDQRERIFTKFFRGANVVRMETEGSGLGLFIAKNIIEAHEGKVWFESKEGKGSTFYFTLPVKKAT